MLRLAPVLPLALVLLAPDLWAQDPFAAGLRWQHGSTAAAPWIPHGVSFSARGDLVWAGALGGSGGLMLLHGAGEGASLPRATDILTTQGATHMDTAAGRRGDALFTVIQSPNPDPYTRRTLVTRHDGSRAPRGGTLSPLWVHDVGFDTNGPARLAVDRDGDRLLIAVWNNATGRVQLDWLDGVSGALLSRQSLPATTLDAIDLCADGSRAVVAAGLDLHVFDGAGTLLHYEPLNSPARCLAISADGATVAVGGLGQVALLAEGGRGWVNRFNVMVPSPELATAVDLSADGRVLGVGWWNSSSGVDVRLEVWDTIRGRVTNNRVLPGTAGGVQNFVEVVDVSPGGERTAFGTWGNGVDAEAFLLEVGKPLSVLEVDLPGSVRDLELDETGTQLLIGYQDNHRNQFTSTGGVALYQSGDRDLVQRDPAESGQVMRLATRWSGATGSFLLVGQRADPIGFPGVAGLLHLDRATLGFQWALPQGGRADFQLSVPADASLIGTQFGIQAAFRTPLGTVLSPHVVEPIILP